MASEMSVASSMSGMSGIDQSEASSVGGGGGGGDTTRKKWAILLGLVFAIFIVYTVFAIVLYTADFGYDEEEEEGPALDVDTTGKKSPEIMIPIPMPDGKGRKGRKEEKGRGRQPGAGRDRQPGAGRDRQPGAGPGEQPGAGGTDEAEEPGPAEPAEPEEPEKPEKPEDVEQETAPPKPTPYKELVCTVGAEAVLDRMYPADGLCNYVYYTEIIVDETLRTPWQDKGWLMFQEMMQSRSNTGGGIGFDINYVTPEALRKTGTATELQRLALENVQSYGLLNVIARHNELKKLLNKAKDVLQELKTIQERHNAGKTLLAIGLYDYSDPAAWGTYKSLFKEAVDGYKADTVIAISSGGNFESEKDCVTVPTSVIKSSNAAYPSLERHGELVKEDFHYDKFSAVVGLSYQLAILTYQLKDATGDINQVPYKKCTAAGFGDAEIYCDPKNRHKDHDFGRVGFIIETDNKHVYFGDDKKSVMGKAQFVKNLPVRNRFSWLVFNVHLTALRDNVCFKPFGLLQQIKADLDQY